MLEQLSRDWWMIAIRGVAAILFGLLAFVVPGLTLRVLIALFAAYALVDGAFAVGAGVRLRKQNDRWWAIVVQGAVGLFVGFAAIAWPGITALTMVFLIAGWAIATGVLQIVAAIRLHREIAHEWLLGLGGLASIAFGVLMAVRPGAGALTLVWLIGGYAIVFGALQLGVAFELRSWTHRARPVERIPV